jgi:hypothetical protein
METPGRIQDFLQGGFRLQQMTFCHQKYPPKNGNRCKKIIMELLRLQFQFSNCKNFKKFGPKSYVGRRWGPVPLYPTPVSAPALPVNQSVNLI